MKALDLRDAGAVARACRTGRIRVRDVAEEVLRRIAASQRPEAWLALEPPERLRARARDLDARAGEALPLLGVPVAVKDNIDVAGLPSTAGCPAFAYEPARNATVVQRLLDAGALVVGKTHMDQFATGLVGTRSPHGPCRNAYHEAFIAGGSSSGSAVVVAQGIVAAALGTDTAGSGRVPAAMNGVVGLKPTRGLLPVDGVVPACRSLDCVSIFASDGAGAGLLLRVLARPPAGGRAPLRQRPIERRFTVGVPRDDALADLDPEAARLYRRGLRALEEAGARAVEIDYAPFVAASELLYGGAWVAERDAAVGDFIDAHPGAVDPTVAAIVRGSRAVTARRAFEDAHALREIAAAIAPTWERVSVIALPAAPRAFRIDEALADPLGPSRQLGRHHSFMNLLDLCGCTVPVGLRADGVPAGMTLCAPPFSERRLLAIGRRIAAALPPLPPPPADDDALIPVVVAGAHLSGMPLNGELAAAGGRLEAALRTSPDYRLFALAGTAPPKPGLRRVDRGGTQIAVEVWWLPARAFRRVADAVRAPLAMGRVMLEDGREIAGFVCADGELRDAVDISAFGGWKAYLAHR